MLWGKHFAQLSLLSVTWFFSEARGYTLREAPGQFSDGLVGDRLVVRWLLAERGGPVDSATLHLQVGTSRNSWDSVYAAMVASSFPGNESRDLEVLGEWKERGYRVRYDRGYITVSIEKLITKDTGMLFIRVTRRDGSYVLGSTYINVMKEFPRWANQGPGIVKGHVGDLIPIRLKRVPTFAERPVISITVQFHPSGSHVWRRVAIVTPLPDGGVKTEYDQPNYDVSFIGDPLLVDLTFIIQRLTTNLRGEYKITVHYDHQAAVLEHTVQIDIKSMPDGVREVNVSQTSLKTSSVLWLIMVFVGIMIIIIAIILFALYLRKHYMDKVKLSKVQEHC